MKALNREGVQLCYSEAGSGDPPILLVHGGFNDHTYFAPQLEEFSQTRRTIAVDLRGHGESGKPEQDYTIAGFADDLAWLCQQLNIDKPIVVGQSMGGLIALEVAAGFPTLPGGIVILDSPILPPQQLVEAMQPLAAALRTPQYREATRQFLSSFVGFDDDPERRERILEDASSSTPQHVMASSLESYLAYDTAAAAASCKVPVLYVSAGLPLANLDGFRELCPQLMTGQTVGAGHYIQLEVPNQVNAMIERFISVMQPSTV